MSEVDDTLDELRRRIDELDRRIVDILNERAERVLGVRRAKNEAGLEQFDPEREADIQEKLSAVNDGPLGDADLRRIYETLLDVMKSFD